MIYRQIVPLVVAVAVCWAAKDESKRKTRTPGLLHLAHAGEAVGSYVEGSPRGYSGAAGGVGGPHVYIVGGDARVSSHVAGPDSLEEIDQDLRQHYSPGGKDSPNTSFGKTYVPDHSGRTYHLGFLGHGGHLPLALGHHPGGFAISHGGVHPGLGYKVPLLLSHPQVVHSPSYAHVPTSVGHPVANQQHLQGHVSGGHPQYQGAHHSSNPSGNYGSSTPHTLSASPTPLSHTLATPINQHVPLHHPLHSAGHSALQAPLGHGGPFFIPIHALQGQTPYHGHTFGVDHPQSVAYRASSDYKYTPGSYDSEQRTSHAEDNAQRYYDDVQERRSKLSSRGMDQREFESGLTAKQKETYSHDIDSDKSFKYDSEETHSKSEQASFRSNFPSGEKSSLEDVSSFEASGEKSPFNRFKFDFPESFGASGRSFPGSDKVATSYQSIVLETRSVPLYVSKKPPQ